MTSPLRDRLQAAIVPAMKARNRPAVTALRSALAAIENAAAVPPCEARAGATEVPRRAQEESEIAGIVRAEIDERRAAADDYDRLGHPDRAAGKRAEADALATYLDAT